MHEFIMFISVCILFYFEWWKNMTLLGIWFTIHNQYPINLTDTEQNYSRKQGCLKDKNTNYNVYIYSLSKAHPENYGYFIACF